MAGAIGNRGSIGLGYVSIGGSLIRFGGPSGGPSLNFSRVSLNLSRVSLKSSSMRQI